MSDEIAVLPTYPDLRKKVLMEMDFSVRVHTLLSRVYRTVGDFLDAMGVTDQMLSEMTKEIDGDRRYDVYCKVKNRLEKRIKGCGWATSSNIMSLLTNEVRIAELKRVVEGHKDGAVSDQANKAMTLRERYALEFAKVLLQSDLRRAYADDAISRENGEDENEVGLVAEDFYYTACQAARMADALAVALKDEPPGWVYKHDDTQKYSGCRAGVREERMAECAKDVAAAVEASVRLVSPKP